MPAKLRYANGGFMKKNQKILQTRGLQDEFK